MKVALQAVKQRQERDEFTGMINGGIAALKDITERFDSVALRTVAAASGLSDANQSGPDLPSAIVELSVSEKVVKGALAAIKASTQMDSDVLDIVA